MNWEIFQDPEILLRLVLQVALFAASALFSMSETALFSLREADLARLEERYPAQARRMRRLLDEPRRLIVSILCGNELINVAATANLAGIMLAFFGNAQAAGIANTLVMLPLLLLLCEITPKTLAVARPLRMSSRLVEPVITPWVRLVAPLREVVRFFSDRITTLIVGEARREVNILSEDEFEDFLRAVEEEGAVSLAERRLITNLIEAGATPVTQIMVPRPQVAFIDADQRIDDILASFQTLRHRRVPVYRKRRDRVLGVLKEERVLAQTLARQDRLTLEALLEPAMLVPTAMTVGEMAEIFRDGDHHAAIVVNEFGGVEGLVSADDVFGYLTLGRAIFLEEHSEIEEIADGAWRCAGLTPLDMLRRVTNLPLEDHPGVATAGGLAMLLLKRVPEVGDVAVDAGLAFRVEAMEGLLIDKLIIAPEGHPVFEPPDAPVLEQETRP